MLGITLTPQGIVFLTEGIMFIPCGKSLEVDMFKRNFFIVFLYLGIFASTIFAQQQMVGGGDTQAVQANGLGAIISGDVVKAKEDATNSALRNAVEKAVGVIVSSDVLTQNYQTVEDNVYSRSAGYIQSWKIISEKKIDVDNTFEVTVEAVVKLTDLKNDLAGIGVLLARKGKPRMMVIIEENNMNNSSAWGNLNTAESTIIEEFRLKGFQFVDQATVKQNIQKDAALAAAAGDAQAAVALAQSYGAEVIVTGKAVANATTTTVYGTSIRSQQATLNIKAIRADNGSIIAVSSVQDKTTHIDDMTGGAKAIQQGAKKLSADLINKILDQWSKELTSSSKITLLILGIQSFAQLDNFKSSLKYYVRGIESVNQKSYGGGVAELDIETKGTADQLARELQLKDLEKFKVEVTGVSPNKVTIKLSSK
jgi:hypothetical protein